MIDDLGDRMKNNYEDRTRYLLPRRTYTIIRLDGKAFHTFTKNFKRPFDQDLINMMDQTAKALCEQIQGVKLGYVQSDEISLVLTDFEQPKTNAWFDGNLQKMASISASIATAAFNKEYLKYRLLGQAYGGTAEIIDKFKPASFDARVFTIPDYVEVENYLIWRQKDSTKNSISMVAQSLYSHKELHGKDSDAKQEMIFQKGQNWNDYPAGQKRGRCIVRVPVKKIVETFWDVGNKEKVIQPAEVIRNEWQVVEPPIFTQDRNFIRSLVPQKNVQTWFSIEGRTE